MQDVWLWWSSGKDSAWALHELNRSTNYRVTRLLTTENEQAQRVAMHGVRHELLALQAAAVGVSLETIMLPYPCTNAQYEDAITPVIVRAAAAGITHMAFGDIFLRDIRDYRIAMLKDSPIEALFPLWQRDTSALADEMLGAGLNAYVTCIDQKVLPATMAGLAFDHAFINKLPSGADPCGENGEFHTFACAGPMFKANIPIKHGEVVTRDGFVFADLLPAQS